CPALTLTEPSKPHSSPNVATCPVAGVSLTAKGPFAATTPTPATHPARRFVSELHAPPASEVIRFVLNVATVVREWSFTVMVAAVRAWRLRSSHDCVT